MLGYDAHPVSTKAALYATDGSAILVLKYTRVPRFAYGLAGGHVDMGETPDQAMARELLEELGVNDIELEHKDFFTHASGKIILGYTGKIDRNIPFNSPEPETEVGVWLTQDEFKQIDIDPGYKEFALRFWPTS